jgi:DNA-binding FrmR family transcriptional regulator
MHLTEDEKRRLLARLRRSEGQVAAIRRMINSDDPCVQVLTQIAAARGALGKVGDAVLQQHVETCVAEGFRTDDVNARAVQAEGLVEVFRRYGGMGRSS